MKSIRIGQALVASSLACVALAQSNQYIQIPYSGTPVGPDGPWLGVEVASTFHLFQSHPFVTWIFFPYPGAYSQFSNNSDTWSDLMPNATTNSAGEGAEYYGGGDNFIDGFYSLVDVLETEWTLPLPNGNFDFASQDIFTQGFRTWVWGGVPGAVVPDPDNDLDFANATLVNMQLMSDPGAGVQLQQNKTATFNTSLAFWNGESVFRLKNGSSYSPSAPILGLGGTSQGSALPGNSSVPLGMTAEVKKAGGIAAEFFAMHVGSFTEGINGSLYLGGYDTTRSFGKTGVFGFQELTDFGSTGFWPQVPLLDIKLGTETGGSPFNFTDFERSVWGFANLSAADQKYASETGGPKDSVLTVPNSAAPYMRLPQGICEAIASYLPVKLNNDLGFYIWNTQDPAYSKIVRSPAFLEFVMQDLGRTNISIKVPFPLLNLTLEAPLNNGTKLQYFPCVDIGPDESNGPSPEHLSTLGRAFLQGAYFSINYEQNLTFLSQAPGPGFDTTNVNIVQVNSTTRNITGSDISKWDQTWSKAWTPLPGDTTGRPNSQNSSSSSAGSDSSSSGTSQGTKVGLGVGLGLGIPLIGAAAVAAFLLRRRRQAAQNEYSKTAGLVNIVDPDPPRYEDHPGGGATAAGGKVAADQPVQELGAGEPRAQEIDGAAAAAPASEMADTSGPRIVSELPADFAFYEMESADIGGVSRGNSRRVSEMGSLLSPTTATATGQVSPRTESVVSPQTSPRNTVDGKGVSPQTSPRTTLDGVLQQQQQQQQKHSHSESLMEDNESIVSREED